MLTTIKLYGHLGQKYGKIHQFGVRSPTEAIMALEANYPGFVGHILQHSEPGYVIRTDNTVVPEAELKMHRNARVIKIIPVVAGSGKSPVVGIVIGIALIVVTYGAGSSYAAAWMSASGSAFTGAAAMAVTVGFSIGVSLVMGGVTALLAGTPELAGLAGEGKESQPSYNYDGAVNTQAQGYPIPVVYGTMETGSATLSLGVHAERYVPRDRNEPSTGYRISNPLSELESIVGVAEDGAPPPTYTVNENIVVNSAVGTATVDISSQTTANYFSLTGAPGSQVLHSTALVKGWYHVTLRATDQAATPNVIEKVISVAVLDAPLERDGGPYTPDDGGITLVTST